MDTSTEYLVQDATQALGKMIEELTKTIEHLKGVNFETLAEKHPDEMGKYHNLIMVHTKNLPMLTLSAVLLEVMSKPAE